MEHEQPHVSRRQLLRRRSSRANGGKIVRSPLTFMLRRSILGAARFLILFFASVCRIERSRVDNRWHVRACKQWQFCCILIAPQLLRKRHFFERCQKPEESARDAEQRHRGTVHGLPAGWQQVFFFFKPYSSEVSLFPLCFSPLCSLFYLKFNRRRSSRHLSCCLLQLSLLLPFQPQGRAVDCLRPSHNTGKPGHVSMDYEPVIQRHGAHAAFLQVRVATRTRQRALTLFSVARKLGASQPPKAPLRVFSHIGLHGSCF
jgi:hypothetical protein